MKKEQSYKRLLKRVFNFKARHKVFCIAADGAYGNGAVVFPCMRGGIDAVAARSGAVTPMVRAAVLEPSSRGVAMVGLGIVTAVLCAGLTMLCT